MTVVTLKKSTVAGNVPSLVAGELAQNIPDELLFYRDPGGAVTSFKLPGVQLIASGLVTSAANLTISIDPAVIGVMRGFILELTNWRPTTSGEILRLQFGDSGGIDSGVSDYAWGRLFCTEASGSFQDTDSDSSDSAIMLEDRGDTGTNWGSQGTVWLSTNDPAATVRNSVMAHMASAYSASGLFAMNTESFGFRTTLIAMTQFLLKYGSGTISTGRYHLVGIP